MSETHDPWVNVRALRPNPYSHENYYVASEVDAARAAEATQRQQELIDLRANYAQSMRLSNDTLADTLARLAAVEAERDHHARHIDRAWAMLANCYDIESREECERSPLTHDGFLPLEMAIHAIYKRDPKVSELTAERNRLKAALEQVVAAYQMALRSTEGNERPAILAMKAAYLASRAALSGEGTAKP